MRNRSIALAFTLLVMGAPAVALAQGSPASSGAPPASGPTSGSGISDAEFNRIRRAIVSQPAVDLDESQLRFYVEILAKQPRFADFTRGYDFINGPTRRGNPMTHQEYLSMVTPRLMQSSAGITAIETLQFALTNWLGQALIKKALEDVRNARSDQEVQDIRERINRELEAITNSAAAPR